MAARRSRCYFLVGIARMEMMNVHRRSMESLVCSGGDCDLVVASLVEWGIEQRLMWMSGIAAGSDGMGIDLRNSGNG